MIDLDDIAQDRLGFRDRSKALEVRREFRIRAKILDVAGAFPLRVVDGAPALLAGMDAGRDEAGLLAEEGFGTLLQELDQLLLVVRLDREDIDEGGDVAADADGGALARQGDDPTHDRDEVRLHHHRPDR